MCGRYRRKSGKQRIADAFGVTAGLEELDLGPDDDAAPGSMQPVVSMNQDGARQIELMRWGFKRPDCLLFNARSDGIATSRFWRDLFLERRCIVPADAVFEWQPGMAAGNKGSRKQKYEITIPGQQPFGKAGIWNLWKSPKTEQWERTFAILTGEPNELMQPIHNRMTTFLEPRDYAEYLEPSDRPPLHLLRMLSGEKMRSLLIDETPLTNRQVNFFDSQ